MWEEKPVTWFDHLLIFVLDASQKIDLGRTTTIPLLFSNNFLEMTPKLFLSISTSSGCFYGNNDETKIEIR